MSTSFKTDLSKFYASMNLCPVLIWAYPRPIQSRDRSSVAVNFQSSE